MRRTASFALLACVGCGPAPEETDSVPTVSPLAAPDPVSYEYESFCWYDIDGGCQLNDGSKVGDERVNCVGESDTYACVVDALEDIGADGWSFVDLNTSFPIPHVVYLLYRAQ
jgi:hypothetical protein